MTPWDEAAQQPQMMPWEEAAQQPQQNIGAWQNFGNATAKGYNQLGMGLLTAGNNIGQDVGAISPQQAGEYRDAITKSRDDLETKYPTQPGLSRFAGQVIGQNAPSLLAPESLLFGGFTNGIANSKPNDTLGQQALDTGLSMGLSKVGGEAINAGMQGLGSLGSKAINSLSGIKSPLAEAYEEAGITPRLAGDVTGSKSLQGVQAFASKWPFGAGRVTQAAKDTMDEFGNSVESLANSMGSSRTLQEAGTSLQDSGKKWLSNFRTQSEKLWNGIDQTVGNVQVPLSNTSQTIQQLKLQGGGNPAAESFLQSPIVKQFESIIDASPNGYVPWSTGKALRTRVGEHLENPALVADAGGAQAKLLYGALSGDMKTALSFHPNAAQIMPQFQQANAFTSAGHDFIDNTLKPVLNADPEKAASTLLSSGVKGGSSLAEIRQNLPDAADELASVSLRRAMAGPSEGATGNAVSPSRWLSNQDPSRRLSPEARNALFPSSQVQSKMDALDMVANSMKGAQELTGHSNTGTHVGTGLLALDLAQLPMDVWAGHQAGGNAGALAALGAGLSPFAIGPVSGRLAATPALTKFLSTPSAQAPFGFAPSLLSRGLLPYSPQPNLFGGQ